MGVGPNYGMAKGFLATGSTAYTFGEIVKLQVGSGSFATTMNAIARATTATVTATTIEVLGVVSEDLDATRLGTGKAIIGVWLTDIARVLVGAAVTAGTAVTNDATARAISVTRAAAGAQPTQILGIALTGATAAGQYIDVLLTPGANY